MRKIKATIALLLIFCLMVSLAPASTASVIYRFEPEAWQLKRLGLYTGTSSATFTPDLGVTLDRQLGVTLLINFFGKHKDVEAMKAPEVDSILAAYTDNTLISPWARPYMAYAIKNGIVMGTSLTTISPTKPLDGTAFATMMLRRLGYTVDRQAYAMALQTLYQIGGLNANEPTFFNKPQLLKDDAVGMAYTALFAVCSDGQPLIEKLIQAGVVSMDKAVSQRLVRYTNPGIVKLIRKPQEPITRPTFKDVAYYMILDAMVNGVAQIRLPLNAYTNSADKVFALVDQSVRDNPEVLYYSGCTYSSNGMLTLQYSKSADVIKAQSLLLKDKTEAVLKEIILPGMTDYQKELAVHDYIINHCDYDAAGYNSGEIPAESYSAYGALLKGTAVCEGYAEAAKLLLDRSGIQSSIVTGTSKGEGHAWNLVSINGKYYQLDVTWDDPIMADGSHALYHHYFNLTDADMALDHQWNKADYPSCTATDSNYFVVNKLLAQSQNDFVNLVVDRVEQGASEVSVKIVNFVTSGFDYEMATTLAFDRLNRGGSYSVNDIQGIVDISFQ